MRVTLEQADLLDWLRRNQWLVQNGYMPKSHCVLSDPPYFLGSIGKRFGKPGSKPAKYGKDGAFHRASNGFMSVQWDSFSDIYDYQDWVTEWAALLLDYVYPGALGFFFGSPRTYHRLAAGLEDAGWEICDALTFFWAYGSGFPKSHSVEKALDRKAGAERPVVGRSTNGSGPNRVKMANHGPGDTGMGSWDGSQREFDLTGPATDEAAAWVGYGSALKPSYEPCVVARAPRNGMTFADLALTYGTGAFNIDGGRIEANGRPHIVGDYKETANAVYEGRMDGSLQGGSRHNGTTNEGRWPANLLLDEGAAAMLDAQSGVSGPDYRGQGNGTRPGGFANIGAPNGSGAPNGRLYADAGGASRFFYTSKASAFEREAGLDGFDAQPFGQGNQVQANIRRGDIDGHLDAEIGLNRVKFRRCTHPTVKPIRLMEYIATLALPPASVGERRCFVPFAGVASEMLAARLAGFEVVTGIEREADYVAQGRARIAWWAQFSSYDEAKRAYDRERKAEKAREADTTPAQTTLPLFEDAA